MFLPSSGQACFTPVRGSFSAGRQNLAKEEVLDFLGRKNSRLKLLVNLAVIAFCSYFMAQKETNFHQTSQFDQLLIESVAPLQNFITYLKREGRDIFNHYIANASAAQKNDLLVKEVSELKNQIFKFEELTEENKRLKKLLQFGSTTPAAKRVLAQIVAWDAASDLNVIRINKGTADGILLESPVTVAEGLVGYIFRASKHYADVLTILDANNRVDGIVQRTRSHGIVEGFINNRCLMKYVTRTEPVILNDMVITSGLGNIYPRGLVVGKVTKIERESFGITQYIEITPSVDFGRIEEVMVLIGPAENAQHRKEWEQLDKQNSSGT